MHQLNPQEQQRIAAMYKTVIQMATEDVSIQNVMFTKHHAFMLTDCDVLTETDREELVELRSNRSDGENNQR